MAENFESLKEGDVGGAVCTSTAGGASSVGAMAPENAACVVTGTTPSKKKPTKVEERIAARKARNEQLKEAIKNDEVESFLEKREMPERIKYPGSEEYEKQRKGWLSDKKKHDKTIEHFNDGNPSRNNIGDLEMNSRFEDGQVDAFLKWYSGHSGGNKKVKEAYAPARRRVLKENIESSDLFIFVPNGPCVNDLMDEYEDLHGYVDDNDAFTLRADAIKELLTAYEDAEDADIYFCPDEIAESEEPTFEASSEDLERVEDVMSFFDGDF